MRTDRIIAWATPALILSITILGDGWALPVQTFAHGATLALLIPLVPGRLKRSPLDRPLLLWTLWNALSVAWAIHSSIARQAAWALGDGVILFYIATNVRDAALSANVPLLFTAAVFPAIAAGMALVHNPASFFPNPNLLAGYVLLIVFVPWMIFFEGERIPEKQGETLETETRGQGTAAFALAALGTLILFWSGSRTAILIFLLMMGCALPKEPKRRSLTRWAALAAAAAVSWKLMTYKKIWSAFSLQERLLWWTSAARIFWNHPLTGVGIGNFGVVGPLYAKTKTLHSLFAHSFPLQILSETGLTGFLLALWLVLSTARWMRSAQSNPVQKGLALGISAVFLENLIDYNLSAPAHWLLFGWMLGLACPARESTEHSFWRKSDGSLAPALAAVTMAFIFLGMESSSRPWRADRWARQGTADLNRGRTEAARESLRRARRLDSTSLEALGLSFHLQSRLSQGEGASHLEEMEAELNEWRGVPATGTLWLALARLWEERGEKETARRCFNTAVAVNPLLVSQR
jgi:O-antigen ligase